MSHWRLRKGWFGLLVAFVLPFVGINLGARTVTWAQENPHADQAWAGLIFFLSYFLGWGGYLWIGLVEGEKMGRKKAQAKQARPDA